MNAPLEAFKLSLRGKRIAVIGAGISNRPLLHWLFPLNPNLTVFDMMAPDDPRLLAIQADFQGQGIEVDWVTGPHYLDRLTGFDLIFRTPKMKLDLPQLLAERQRGALITSEIALFTRLCPAPIYGITGSDGKTTTTSLISRILEEAGHRVYTGGNIGRPLIDRIDLIRPEDRVVLELSSFQLMDMKERIHRAIITNIIPNHLDFHKDFQEYQEAKQNLYRYQTEDDILVLNACDPLTPSMAREAAGEVRFFNEGRQDSSLCGWRQEGKLCLGGKGQPPQLIVEEKEVLLPGSFNLENILAAAVATAGDAPLEAMAETARSFKGVAHRMERVAVIDGVPWHNSSVDSSPSRTIKTLSAFYEQGLPLVLITGGQDKKSDYRGLGRAIAQSAKKIILSGQNADLILDSIRQECQEVGVDFGCLEIVQTESYAQAVQLARQMAKPGECVLFSPAGTSYDRYHHFEERGNHFRQLVAQLYES